MRKRSRGAPPTTMILMTIAVQMSLGSDTNQPVIYVHQQPGGHRYEVTIFDAAGEALGTVDVGPSDVRIAPEDP